MSEKQIKNEIERIEKSREVDNLNFSVNITLYIGGMAILFSVVHAFSLQFGLQQLEGWLLLVALVFWSLYIRLLNLKVNENFGKKSIMIDKRYKKIGVNLNKLNKEFREISPKEVRGYYKKQHG